ncbi:HAMP domain-containing histidine kinase [Roseobacter sp. YSTF-M11]|uniref:histidine kinase n=1 Tax=Roseobacter insulae TaxID=2859783 RepID=A0A9X1FW83_9RHOB|nr:HAMP domain-containing sensor histidine kinase [Roseobacter insulae]MBW4709205.1 HAMP domain-containing histidine kinase [Roseobacter insulae]
MSIANLLRALAALMLMVALSGAALAYWSAKRAAFFNERINLAHQSYEMHLQLSGNTYQLFKQYGDAMLIGDRDQGMGEAELIRLIRENIRTIRGLIGQEIELVGDEEIEELELLSQIERKIEDLIARFEVVRKDTAVEQFGRNWTGLSVMLDDEIDRDFHSMIQMALEEELEEVEETRTAAAHYLQMANTVAVFLVVLALGVVAGALWIYTRAILRPMRRLMQGVSALADGKFAQRMNFEGRNEIAEIGGVMDGMAAMVEARTQSLTTQNTELEEAVRVRTAELEELLEKSRVAEEARRQMLADVSHELRTPLTIIQGESDVALRGADKTIDEYREALRRTRETAKHTNLLVNDLLFISREEAGQTRLKRERVDLKKLLQEAIAVFDPDIPVITDLDSAEMSLDISRIRQCLAAMIQNARRYGGPDISVRLLRTPAGYRVSVEDNGPGLPDAEKEKAFERFFRGSNAAGQYEDGAGLGLPVVRAIAQAHGGNALLQDRDGGGLSSIMELPLSSPLRVVSES